MLRVPTQTFKIDIPQNTPVNTVISQRFRTDNRGSVLNRLRFYAKNQTETNGGLGANVDYEIAVKDDQELHKAFTLWKDFYCSPNVALEKRGIPLGISAMGREITIEVKILDVTTQAGVLYFVVDYEPRKDNKPDVNLMQAATPTSPK